LCRNFVFTALEHDTKLAKEIIPKIIQDLLNTAMAKHPNFAINIPKGLHYYS
jgi:hypothetical protein